MSSEHHFPIFISSTDYNLVDLKAELASCLEAWHYKPIFSRDEGFPDKSPDLEPWESCLPALGTCYIMILIVDGRYGKPLPWPSYSKQLAIKKKISPTHGEYRFAHKCRMRTLVFIREEVMVQYQSYRTALTKAKGDKKKAKQFLKNTLPKHIDINTLEFVEEIKTTRPIPWISEFKDVTDIKLAVQKKLLNELADVFMNKQQNFEKVAEAFTKLLNEQSPEKRKAVLKGVGVSNDLIADMEERSKRIQSLKKEEESIARKIRQAEKDLHDKKRKKRMALEAKQILANEIDSLANEHSRLQRQIENTESASASVVTSGGIFRRVIGGGIVRVGDKKKLSSVLSDSGSIDSNSACVDCGQYPVALGGSHEICSTCGKKVCLMCERTHYTRCTPLF